MVNESKLKAKYKKVVNLGILPKRNVGEQKKVDWNF